MRATTLLIFPAALLIGLGIGLVTRDGKDVDRTPTRAGVPGPNVAPVDPVDPAPAPRTRSSTAPQASPGAVSVAGLMVHRTLHREGEHGESLAFFGTFASTRLALELDLAQVAGVGERRIVALDRDASTVTRFTDDRGTDLLAETEFSGPYEMMPRTSVDGLGLQTVVSSKLSPHAAATRLAVEGSLAVLCASQKREETSASVELAQGSTLTVGDLSFEVQSTGQNDWDESKWDLELRTTGSLDEVLSWSLVTPDGQVHPLEESSTWTMNDTVQKTLVAPQAFAAGALRLERWIDAELVQVPFELDASVGIAR